MPFVELPSTRLRATQRAGQADVYVYDTVPPKFRVQLTYLIGDTFGEWHKAEQWALWLLRTIAREHGRNFSGYHWQQFPREFLEGFIKNEGGYSNSSDLEVLDILELLLKLVDGPEYESSPRHSARHVAGIIHEANLRLTQNGIGWQYERSVRQLVCLSDEFTHAHIVRPVLALLGETDTSNANAELVIAFEQFRNENWKDCIAAAGRAFEATLKAICGRRGWAYEDHDNAKKLLLHCRQGGLLPDWLDTTLSRYYWDMLEQSIPRTRNKAGGHGDGPDAAEVTADLATFAIHQTAANILLVLQREKSLTGGRR